MFKGLRPFWPLLIKYKKHLSIATIALILVDAIDVIPPLIIGKSINILQDNEDYSLLLYMVLLLILLVTMQMFFRYFMRFYFHEVSFHVAKDIRNKFYKKLLSIKSEYYDKTSVGDLMTRATTDIEAVRIFPGRGLFIGIDIILYFIFVPPIMIWIDPGIAVISFVFVPILPFVILKFGNYIRERFRESQQILSNLSGFVEENISGVRVVKSFAIENEQNDKFDEYNAQYRKKIIKLSSVQAGFQPLLQLLVGIGMLIVIYFGGIKTLKGEITTGAFVAYMYYLQKLAWPMMGLGWTIQMFQNASASMNRLQEVFDIKTDEKSENNFKCGEVRLEGNIKLRNVTMKYPGYLSNSLDNVSYEFEKNKFYAIVGPIGAGKTTLLELLVGLYNITEGEILFDNINMQDIPLDQLRNQISYIPQDVFLFSDSIKNNIAFGVDNPDENEIKRMAEIADVDKSILEMDEKFDSLLGERGVNLSGGQKQRVSIARALLKNSKILIMDDCFASVDTGTEREILLKLKDYIKNKTVIALTHRLPILQLADEILFMQNGKIAENGNHKELIDLKGQYFGFYQYQKNGDKNN